MSHKGVKWGLLHGGVHVSPLLWTKTNELYRYNFCPSQKFGRWATTPLFLKEQLLELNMRVEDHFMFGG